jgi:hypothetical protein
MMRTTDETIVCALRAQIEAWDANKGVFGVFGLERSIDNTLKCMKDVFVSTERLPFLVESLDELLSEEMVRHEHLGRVRESLRGFRDRYKEEIPREVATLAS